MSLASLAEELRSLRRRIDAQEANAHDWPTKEEEMIADLDRYDRRLIKAARMLRLSIPVGQGREAMLLREHDRAQFEKRLMDSGLDVRAPADAAHAERD